VLLFFFRGLHILQKTKQKRKTQKPKKHQKTKSFGNWRGEHQVKEAKQHLSFWGRCGLFTLLSAD